MVYCSAGHTGQVEGATRNPRQDCSERFDRVFGAGRVAGLEVRAGKICRYAPTLVPGLLQTADCARAAIRVNDPLLAAEEVEERVADRRVTGPEREKAPLCLRGGPGRRRGGVRLTRRGPACLPRLPRLPRLLRLLRLLRRGVQAVRGVADGHGRCRARARLGAC